MATLGSEGTEPTSYVSVHNIPVRLRKYAERVVAHVRSNFFNDDLLQCAGGHLGDNFFLFLVDTYPLHAAGKKKKTPRKT